jgi:hypothetical protein
MADDGVAELSSRFRNSVPSGLPWTLGMIGAGWWGSSMNGSISGFCLLFGCGNSGVPWR